MTWKSGLSTTTTYTEVGSMVVIMWIEVYLYSDVTTDVNPLRRDNPYQYIYDYTVRQIVRSLCVGE